MPEIAKIDIARPSVTDVTSIKNVEVACGLSPWTVSSYEQEMSRSDSVILAARVGDGDIVGFITGRISSGPGSEAEIHNIGVLPEFRERGIGTFLIEEFRRISGDRGAAAIWLEVRRSNAGAIAFYGSKGFSIEGNRRNFYSDPAEDAALMCLRLPKPSGP